MRMTVPTPRVTSAIRLFAALLFSLVGAWSARALAFVPPAPQGAVTDTSGKLTLADDAALEAEIAGYRARTGHELAVLMVGSLGGESVDDVAYAAFNTWGVGRKGADDGVLLVIAPNERKMRIETGKGVGDRLTDLESSHILREKVGPLLKENRFREAISAGLTAIEAALDSGGADVKSPPRKTPAPRGSVAWILPLVVLGFCLFVVLGTFYLIIRASRRTRTKVGSYGSAPSSYGSSDWSSGSSSSSSSQWGGGGGSDFGSGFSGGGGSDFGGGSSGGGGSDFGGGSSGGGGSSDSY